MNTDGLGIVIQTAINQICEFVNRGNENLDDHEHARRQALVAMLNKLPFVCRSLITHATADVRFVYIMWYERVRMGASNSGFFLEAMGRGLPLFTGHVPVPLLPAQVRSTTYRDVVADRVRTITRLESPEMRDIRLANLVTQHRCNDVPHSVPGRIHVFVSRARALAQGLAAVKPEQQFAQCRNRCCNRRFFVSTERGDDATAADASGSGASLSHADVGESTYWELTSSAPLAMHLPASFCTWACSHEWRAQLESAVPTDDPHQLAGAERSARTGRARVSDSLRFAVKRNEREARKLRAIEKERRRFPAVTRSEVRAERARRVRALNVDLGVLYAASVVAESSMLAAGKVLPGASPGWRSRPRFYAAAIRKVAAVYDKHHRGNDIISNLFGHSPFLAKVRERAGSTF